MKGCHLGCRAASFVGRCQRCGFLPCWYYRVFWLSCCFSMTFFRSGLNFVLCLHSGVGKGGLGYFSCPLVPSLASRPRIWSYRSGAFLFGKPDAIGTHPALRAPFLICILQAPAFHTTHLAFSWPQTHLVCLSFLASGSRPLDLGHFVFGFCRASSTVGAPPGPLRL